MVTLLSDKIIFKIRNKDHFEILRGLIHQEDIPILRKKMHLRIESKHKAKIDNIEGRYSPTIIVGDVTIPPTIRKQRTPKITRTNVLDSLPKDTHGK